MTTNNTTTPNSTVLGDDPGLEVRDLTVEYRSGAHLVRALDGMDLSVRPGELVVLLGPSGSGKTTLLSCVGGLLRPTSGSIRLAGNEVTALSRRGIERHRRDAVGFVFQAFNLVASLTARENVAAPAMLTGLKRRAALRRADDLLDMVGLADRGHHRPGQLSGGEQQRVAIARGLVRRPRLLLADEPTANLDHRQADLVMDLLLALRDHGRMVLVSTHDTTLASVADRVVDVGAARSGAGDPQLAAGR